MSLRLIFDDDPVALGDRLVDCLVDVPSAPQARANGLGPPAHSFADPFAEDVLIVPGLGTGAWLARRVADRLGVATTIRQELAGRFLWWLTSQWIGGVARSSPFDASVARWVVLRLLEQRVTAAAEGKTDSYTESLRPLIGRLQRASGTQRLALATEIAELFDRYLVFRRDWLDLWQAGKRVGGSRRTAAAGLGEHEAWQAWLWRGLLAELSGVSERHPFEQLIDRLRDPGPLPTLRVRQVIVYGLLSMAPEQFQLFGAIAKRIPVTFIAPEPSREFWHDIVSPRYAAQLRAKSPESAWLLDDGPSILGSWGQAHRDYLVQLRQLEETYAGVETDAVGAADPKPAVEVDDSYRERDLEEPTNRLQALRGALTAFSDEAWDAIADSEVTPGHDESLQIHGCAGATRQVEVLYDVLSRAFQRDPSLTPGQVVVFCVDLATFAPLIDAVFGAGTLPFRISGHSSLDDPLAAAVIEMLSLAVGDAERAGVENLLENAALMAAWTIDAEDVQQLSNWLERIGVYRGLQAEPGSDATAFRHSWRQAIDRLWLGFSVADDAFEGQRAVLGDLLAVAGVTGGTLTMVERLETLIETLADLHDLARRALSVTEWSRIVRERLQWLLDNRAMRGASWLASTSRLDDALTRTAESAQAAAGSAAPVLIDLPTFARALQLALEPMAGAAQASGMIDFVPVGALRGIPFRVIAWLGMDEGKFPGNERALEFDLMAVAPRFGDRLAGATARGVFLDSLLAARDQLTLLFQSNDVRDNSETNSSAVVQELLDYVRAQPGQEAFEVIEHPLQPFSPRTFEGPLRGFAAQWLAPARAVAARNAGGPAMTPAPIPAALPSSQTPSPRGDERLDRLRTCWDEPSGQLPVPIAGRRMRVTQLSIASALADPSRAYLREGVGVELPFEQKSTRPIEPLDSELQDSMHLLDEALERIDDEASVDARAAAWLASPIVAGGNWGHRTQSRLRAEYAALSAARAGFSASLPPARLSCTIAGIEWQSHDCWFDARSGTITQVLPRANVRLLQEILLWIGHQVIVAAVADGQWRTLPGATKAPVPTAVHSWLIAPGKKTQILDAALGEPQGHDALAALPGLFGCILRDAVPLMPRTYRAFVEKSDGRQVAELPDDPEYARIGDAKLARGWNEARNKYVGNSAYDVSGSESRYAWHAAMLGEPPPPLLEVLRYSEAAYRPILSRLHSIKPK